MLDVYLIARFLAMDGLLKKIMKHCIDIFGPNYCGSNMGQAASNHMASLLVIADYHMDEELMERAIDLVVQQGRSFSILDQCHRWDCLSVFFSRARADAMCQPLLQGDVGQGD